MNRTQRSAQVLVPFAMLSLACGEAGGAGRAAGPLGQGVELVGDRRIPFTPADDVQFIDFFVAHHRMAIDMAERVLVAGEAEAVKTLATQIRDAQQVEIDLMKKTRAELTGVTQIEPPPDDPHTLADLDVVRTLTGDALDRFFLESMIAHHAFGLPPDHRARPRLENKEMLDVARSIFNSQAQQIGEMMEMLGSEPVGDEPQSVGDDANLVGDRRIGFTPSDDVAFIAFFAPHHEQAIEYGEARGCEGSGCRNPHSRAGDRNHADNGA